MKSYPGRNLISIVGPLGLPVRTIAEGQRSGDRFSTQALRIWEG